MKYSLEFSRDTIAISGSSYGTFVVFEQARALTNNQNASEALGQNMEEMTVASDY